MNKINYIVFDMDGLLADTEKHYRDGWIHGSKKLGYNLSKEDADAWVGQGIDTTLRILAEKTGSYDKADKIRLEREGYIYEQLYSNALKMKPGVREILEYIKDKGIEIGLATSTERKRSESILKHFEINDYIKYRAFGDEVENVKPAPDLYLKALQLGGYKADETLVIEDSITGTKAAKNAGIPVVLVPDQSFVKGYFKDVPDNVVFQGTDLNQVIDWFRKNL